MTVTATVTATRDIRIRRQKRLLNQDSMSDVWIGVQREASSKIKDGTYIAKPRTRMFVDHPAVNIAIRNRWKPVERQILG